MDQKLWTQVEKTRAKIMEAKWWIDSTKDLLNDIHSIDIIKRSMSELAVAKQENILAQSSDREISPFAPLVGAKQTSTP